ncbi:efflux RND transporter permease subunit [Tautonia plasticadhaerens]|uniref:Cobalt-zinc-cadmium resistance protein CzcA n=1 Tax=Tautonia plasticadhaerens TaxID=2527974 RepID=A0A518GZS4_9BACT|nr:CusA/CzcA family heavy metal efflux RND transporter [Tautonia plasticadhaerens]QDV34085.1 Cobalt-zinc-cadmium resistance protein CzcA [Tautonia plasticadhaerens]
MIDRIIVASLDNRLIVLLLAALLVAGGVGAALRLPIDAVPDVTNVQVQVLTNAPGLGPVEVEQYVTFPVEAAMSGLPRVEEVRSVTRFGLSAVTIVFEEGTDIYWARNLVDARLGEATRGIPEGYGEPEMGPISSGLGEIFQFEVRAEPGYDHDLMELRSILDWQVAFQLRSLPGVVEVNAFGGELKTYEVQLDPSRLLHYRIPLNDVFEALERNNHNQGGGYIVHDREQRIVRGEGLIRDLDDVGDIVLASREDGTPVLVRDVGEVRFDPMLRQGAVTRDGEGEAVIGIVMMLIGENGRVVVDRVKERIAEIEGSLPPGVVIDPFYDRTDLIGRTIATVVENVSGGALLVVVMLLLLVGDLRAGLIVAAAIPLSALGMILAMEALGVSANLMSLGAVDFGIIVDGAVVVVENCIRRAGAYAAAHPERRSVPMRVFRQASKEVGRPVLFSGLVVILVFLPVLSLRGIEGAMFRPMAISFMSALAGALVLSVTVMPVLASLLLAGRVARRETALVRGARAAYAPVLRRALDRPWLAVGSAGVLLAVGAVIAPGLGAEFIPRLDEGAVAFQAWRLPSVSLEESIEGTTNVERVLMQFPEVDTVVSKTGRPEIATDPMGVEISDIFVMLHPRAEISPLEWPLVALGLRERPVPRRTTTRSPADLREVMRAVHREMTGEAEIPEAKDGELLEWATEIFRDFERRNLRPGKDRLVDAMDRLLTRYVPSNSFSDSQPIELRVQELISGVRSDVGISLYGPDLGVLERKGDEIVAAVAGVPGGADVRAQRIAGQPNIRIVVDRDALARYDINAADVLDAVSAIGGNVVGQVLEGQPRFPLQARYAPEYRSDLEALRQIRIADPLGRQIPLEQLADLSVEEGPALVTREAIQRRLQIEANVRGRDLAGFVAEAQQAVRSGVDLPPGYVVSWGGQFENLREAAGRLAIAVPVALLLIFALLYATFGSLRLTMLIFLNVPIAATGGILALWLRGMPFSISAGIGFIALFGIAVMNGVVLVEHVRDLRRGGADRREAVFGGAMDRLRPVLMTATTDALGFLPMALSTGAGAEVQRPLATVVIGGVVTSTVLTLVVLPAIYHWFEPPERPAEGEEGDEDG